MTENASLPLACPRCALRYPLEERFCAKCGMPLTYAGRVNAEEEASERRQAARKVKPQYARGALRKVTVARQQPEAELLQMMLLEEGIPSTLRRSGGFDVPDFLAAGPRDVLVPESGYEAARDLLLESDSPPDAAGTGSAGASGRAYAPPPLLVLAAGIVVPLLVLLALVLAGRGSL